MVDRAIIAIHEAAHAVVAVHFELWIERVALVEDNGEVPLDLEGVIFSTPATDDDRRTIGDIIAVGLAGPIADERTGAPDLERRKAQHVDRASSYAARYLPAGEIEAMIDARWSETRALVDAYWPTIEEVAHALQVADGDEISMMELRAIMGLATEWDGI